MADTDVQLQPRRREWPAGGTILRSLAALSPSFERAPASDLTDLLGVDVASYQDPIDWRRVESAKVHGRGISFAYIKATEGTTYRHPNHAVWSREAEDVGIVTGGYHFALPSRLSRSAENQAHYFADALAVPHSLPPVLDLEMTGGLTLDALAEWTSRFVTTLKLATGWEPMLYVGAFFGVDLPGHDLWLPSYTNTHVTNPDPEDCPAPMLPPGRHDYHVWQYTSTGQVDGIAGDVDLNLAAPSWLRSRSFIEPEEPEVLDPTDPTVKKLLRLGDLTLATLEGHDRGRGRTIRSILGGIERKVGAAPTIIDPAELADEIAADLGDDLAGQVLDALAARLANTEGNTP